MCINEDIAQILFPGFFFFLENILVILWNKDHGKIEKENWRAGMIIKKRYFHFVTQLQLYKFKWWDEYLELEWSVWWDEKWMPVWTNEMEFRHDLYRFSLCIDDKQSSTDFPFLLLPYSSCKSWNFHLKRIIIVF